MPAPLALGHGQERMVRGEKARKKVGNAINFPLP